MGALQMSGRLFISFTPVNLVFGGDHVVLPLLEQELVPTGWINEVWSFAVKILRTRNC